MPAPAPATPYPATPTSPYATPSPYPAPSVGPPPVFDPYSSGSTLTPSAPTAPYSYTPPGTAAPTWPGQAPAVQPASPYGAAPPAGAYPQQPGCLYPRWGTHPVATGQLWLRGPGRLLGQNPAVSAGVELRVHLPVRQAHRPEGPGDQSGRAVQHVRHSDLLQHRHAPVGDARVREQLAGRATGQSGSRAARPDLPPRVYDAYLDFAWYPRINQWFGGELGFRTGVWTDFDHVTTDSVRFLGRGLVSVSLTPQMDILFGAVYLDRLHVKLPPAGGVYWRPTPRMGLLHRISQSQSAEVLHDDRQLEVVLVRRRRIRAARGPSTALWARRSNSPTGSTTTTSA